MVRIYSEPVNKKSANNEGYVYSFMSNWKYFTTFHSRPDQIELMNFKTFFLFRNLHLSIPILRLLLMSGQVVKFDCEVIDFYEPPPPSTWPNRVRSSGVSFTCILWTAFALNKSAVFFNKFVNGIFLGRLWFRRDLIL